MTSIETAVKNSQIVVFVLSPKAFSKQVVEIAKALCSVKGIICYVSLNKPYMSVKASLEKAGVPTEKLRFVDAVSSKAGTTKNDNNSILVSSPQALTELSIAIGKGLDRWKADAVMFDSLSTLLVYEGHSSILRFVHSITNSMRVKGLSCAFTILKPDFREELAKDIGMFADEIKEMG